MNIIDIGKMGWGEELNSILEDLDKRISESGTAPDLSAFKGEDIKWTGENVFAKTPIVEKNENKYNVVTKNDLEYYVENGELERVLKNYNTIYFDNEYTDGTQKGTVNEPYSDFNQVSLLQLAGKDVVIMVKGTQTPYELTFAENFNNIVIKSTDNIPATVTINFTGNAENLYCDNLIVDRMSTNVNTQIEVKDCTIKSMVSFNSSSLLLNNSQLIDSVSYSQNNRVEINNSYIKDFKTTVTANVAIINNSIIDKIEANAENLLVKNSVLGNSQNYLDSCLISANTKGYVYNSTLHQYTVNRQQIEYYSTSLIGDKTIYYVSKTIGSDTNGNGTIQSPFASIDMVSGIASPEKTIEIIILDNETYQINQLPQYSQIKSSNGNTPLLLCQYTFDIKEIEFTQVDIQGNFRGTNRIVFNECSLYTIKEATSSGVMVLNNCYSKPTANTNVTHTKGTLIVNNFTNRSSTNVYFTAPQLTINNGRFVVISIGGANVFCNGIYVSNRMVLQDVTSDIKLLNSYFVKTKPQAPSSKVTIEFLNVIEGQGV